MGLFFTNAKESTIIAKFRKSHELFNIETALAHAVVASYGLKNCHFIFPVLNSLLDKQSSIQLNLKSALSALPDINAQTCLPVVQTTLDFMLKYPQKINTLSIYIPCSLEQEGKQDPAKELSIMLHNFFKSLPTELKVVELKLSSKNTQRLSDAAIGAILTAASSANVHIKLENVYFTEAQLAKYYKAPNSNSVSIDETTRLMDTNEPENRKCGLTYKNHISHVQDMQSRVTAQVSLTKRK